MPPRLDLGRAGGRPNRRTAVVVLAGAALAARTNGRRGRAQEDLVWEALPGMPEPRSELAAAAIGQATYVVGGFGGGNRVDRFDTVGLIWERVIDLPGETHHPGVAALDGILYVAGGYGPDALDNLWAYDPAADAWTERAPLPEARGALGLAALDGRLYAVGGATAGLGGPVTGAVDAYDPAVDAWSAVTTMPTPREHLAVAAGDGRLWTGGGRANGDDSPAMAEVAEVYDPATDAWATLPPLPTPRGGVAGAWVAGRFVTVGGETFSPNPFANIQGPVTYDAVEAYDPAADAWAPLPPLPTARHGLATAVVGETLYAIAGGPIAGSAEADPAVEALAF
jgi:N-acetylneuraminic acid mutarotase